MRRRQPAFADIECNGDSVLIGVEHEYRLFSGEQQVDFRRLIHGLALGQRHLDPGDPNSYRLDSGAALTCDEAEAEIALPPVALEPGFAGEIDGRACYERARLEALVPDLHVEGYSTHLSVSTPASIGDRVALLYTRTFAPALMLLMDHITSQGLLVRPRPERTELGGEFVEGARLRAAATFAAASVLTCHAAVVTRSAGMPDELELRVHHDGHRYGWFVDRCASGKDLRNARRVRLNRAEGGTISAQAHLEAAWTSARDKVAGRVGSEDVDAVDRFVSGDLLPYEATGRGADAISVESMPPTPFGEVLRTRRHDTFDATPVMLGWDAAILVVVGREHRRHAFLCVPRAVLGNFLDALDARTLDGAIEDYLERRALRLRRLHRHHQTVAIGLYDRLGPRRRLLPLERAAESGPVGNSRHFGRWRLRSRSGGLGSL